MAICPRNSKNNSLFAHIWHNIVIFFIFVAPSVGFGQIESDTLASDTLVADAFLSDTLLTTHPDSLKQPIDTSTLRYQISPDSLDAPVFFNARDSIEYDIQGRRILLYGQAVVKYQTITLEAGMIDFNWATNVLTADYVLDSLQKPIEKPKFADGDQNFTSDKIKYNFKTKKGLVIDAHTFESNLYVISDTAKFHSKDTLHSDDYVYGKNAIFTTCDADHPHYGIRSKKQKVVPNKIVVVGPSNVEIADVPTPLFLPFGFFPVAQKRSSGLIFPQDYEQSPQLGFGLKNIGWYFPLGPNFDLKLTGDLYMKGSWGSHAQVQYKKRYKYNGDFVLSYSVIKEEIDGVLGVEKSRPLKFRWNHRQDGKAHPYNNFSASVNIETNKYERITQNQAHNVLNNTYRSNISFRKKFSGTPFSMTANASHSQVVSTGKVTMELPTLDIRMAQIYPFKRKIKIGPERWYEKFSLTYSANTKNRIETTDSTLLDRSTWANLNIGAQHKLNTNASFRVLKYFNLTPRADYQELWYFKRQELSFDGTPVIGLDTIYNPDSTILNIVNDTMSYGQIDTIIKNGFNAVRTFSLGASLNTQIFGTMRFRKGPLRGIRHTIKPSFGFNYQPDFTTSPFDYYSSIQTDSRQAPDEYDDYYYYPDGIYGQAPSVGKQMALTYSLSHIFEAKLFSRKDSTEKITRLFDNLSMGGSYNFAADSLNFSKISISGRTKLLKNFSNMSLSATYDPYAVDEDGTTIDQFYWKTDKKPLRFVNLSMGINSGFTLRQLADLIKGNNTDQKADKPDKKERHEAKFFDWFSSFRLSHSFRMNFVKDATTEKLKGLVTIHTLNTNGRISLSPKWDLTVGNIGYDFKRENMTYPDFGISRNLHCWNMGVNWQPQRGTYSFFLKVTQAPMDFLKLPYSRNYFDASQTRF